MLFLGIKARSKQAWGSAFLSQHKDRGGKNHILPCRRAFSNVLDGVASTIFPRGEPPDPQLSLTPYACSINDSFPTTLSTINTMLVKVGQCKFYMTFGLAFTRFSLPPPPQTKLENIHHCLDKKGCLTHFL